jgi:hypothetical protein
MVICRYQQIGNSIVVTDHQNEKIQQIARYNNCRIDQIDVKTEMEVYSIPKALSPSANASNSIIEQSNELTSTLTMKKVSVSNGSIEIHLTNQSISLPVRFLTILCVYLRAFFREILPLFPHRLELLKKGLNI